MAEAKGAIVKDDEEMLCETHKGEKIIAVCKFCKSSCASKYHLLCVKCTKEHSKCDYVSTNEFRNYTHCMLQENRDKRKQKQQKQMKELKTNLETSKTGIDETERRRKTVEKVVCDSANRRKSQFESLQKNSEQNIRRLETEIGDMESKEKEDNEVCEKESLKKVLQLAESCDANNELDACITSLGLSLKFKIEDMRLNEHIQDMFESGNTENGAQKPKDVSDISANIQWIKTIKEDSSNLHIKWIVTKPDASLYLGNETALISYKIEHKQKQSVAIPKEGNNKIGIVDVCKPLDSNSIYICLRDRRVFEMQGDKTTLMFKVEGNKFLQCMVVLLRGAIVIGMDLRNGRLQPYTKKGVREEGPILKDRHGNFLFSIVARICSSSNDTIAVISNGARQNNVVLLDSNFGLIGKYCGQSSTDQRFKAIDICFTNAADSLLVAEKDRISILKLQANNFQCVGVIEGVHAVLFPPPKSGKVKSKSEISCISPSLKPSEFVIGFTDGKVCIVSVVFCPRVEMVYTRAGTGNSTSADS